MTPGRNTRVAMWPGNGWGIRDCMLRGMHIGDVKKWPIGEHLGRAFDDVFNDDV